MIYNITGEFVDGKDIEIFKYLQPPIDLAVHLALQCVHCDPHGCTTLAASIVM